ncbi:MAG: DUF5916 domain-containing protein [Gemmatimonadaceae bacterium]
MLLPVLLLAQTLSGVAPTVGASQPVYGGRQGQVQVRIPRIDADAKIDGQLDEAAWTQAALLTGFSQYSPIDGIPAEDSTEVLVWYSPTAIHFGVRAYERHGTVNATLADRDRIGGDDHVQFLVSTFNDRRQATVFGVNPLGGQLDGTLVESNQNRSGGFGSVAAARDAADLSPDFVFQSKGRLTDYGYEVEVRVPFKSLRYQEASEQSWGFNVVRRVQHAGVEDTWAPARQASVSFLAQSGTLTGLADLRRGLVLDLNPVVTQHTAGAISDETGRWRYDRGDPEFGANLRWGITNNMTLNSTINPDFSQVESDAPQFAFDPRQAIFFSEKRPFFLEGQELFSTPNGLVYTRRIVEPVGAAKLTGKAAGTNIAVLSAVDDRTFSATYDPSVPRSGDNPVFNIVRLQRDIGGQSRLGATVTDREDGRYFNRVANVDGRLVFRRLYSASLQVAGSSTRLRRASGDTTITGPLWDARVNRNGRHFGFTYSFQGFGSGFRTQSGFLNRASVVNAVASHRFTKVGRREGLLQEFSFSPVVSFTWNYDRFVHQGDAIEKKYHLNTSAIFRGGWNGGASVLLETFGYDAPHYAALGYRVARGPGDTVAFVGTPRLYNADYLISINTPQFKTFSGGVFYLWGRDENFAEWSNGEIIWLTVTANWRPTEKLRANFSYNQTTVNRWSDRTNVLNSRIPRLKVEYQLSRAIFLRVVGDYNSFTQDALRDDSRTNAPIVIPTPNGFQPVYAFRSNRFRGDYLFSYQPNPGTVVFVGYGRGFQGFDTTDPSWPQFDPNWRPGRRASDLLPVSDAVFVKVSYLFRM